MTQPLLNIPIRITEAAGLDRVAEPVRIGVPIARGTLHDTDSLCLENDSGKIPLQALVQSRWSDGSVQWLLIDTIVSQAAGASTTWHLRKGACTPVPLALRIAESAVAIEVDTGAAQFRIPRSGEVLLASVQRQGREQLNPDGLRIVFRNGSGAARKARIKATRVEGQGALRATIVAEGVIAGTDRKRPVEFVARLVLHAGSTVLEAELRLRNPRRARHRGGLWDLGDPGSQLIREFALVCQPAHSPKALRWNTAVAQPLRTASDAAQWTIYQDSSGGERWNSPNHLGADGTLTVSFRGYQVRGANGVQEAGDRATPCVEVESDGDAIACAVEGFWQNFPKALRVANGQLQLALFPGETRVPVELQGGEQKRHRAWFAFGAAGEAAAEIARRQQPLQVILDPQVIEASHAIHGFSAPRSDDDPRYLAYMRTIVEGEHSFFAGREHIDEYGWRNFGDVYASHEAVNHQGPEPFITHYNNQYDVVLGTLLQGLRSGDARWFELARDLAWHVADIDVYHTQDDKPAYNGGLFWHSDHYLPAGLATHRTYSRVNAKGSYGGGPDNEHNYTSGLLTWHYLTGDTDAAETVLALAEFVLAMDDGKRTIFRFLDRGPTGNASKTVSMDYHGPGRGAGNSINALMDAFWLTRERRYLAKAEELVRRCIHPADDISKLELTEPEYRWSYLVFLQVLGKYLALKSELDEMDEGFHYARDSLLHYAKWMLEHERPYKEQFHKMLLPTETWPAQDVRKARVLRTATQYCGDELLSRRLHESADFYTDRCLSDLLAFPTACLARPRVLLAVYGSSAAVGQEIAANWPEAGTYQTRIAFASQKARVLGRIRKFK